MVRKDSLAQLLDEGRRKIQVTDEELDEAKRRRRLLATSARRAFPGSTTYFNGSVAHGDANTPLTDVDLGVVLSRRTPSRTVRARRAPCRSWRSSVT